jgi:hypothetical protein
MLTLVAAVDVYDRAADGAIDGAIDAFELLSSPRVSRYAISWTSVENDMMAMKGWMVGRKLLLFSKPQSTSSEECPPRRFQISRLLKFVWSIGSRAEVEEVSATVCS